MGRSKHIGQSLLVGLLLFLSRFTVDTDDCCTGPLLLLALFFNKPRDDLLVDFALLLGVLFSLFATGLASFNDCRCLCETLALSARLWMLLVLGAAMDEEECGDADDD